MKHPKVVDGLVHLRMIQKLNQQQKQLNTVPFVPFYPNNHGFSATIQIRISSDSSIFLGKRDV